MTPARQVEIERRARTDAAAHKSGWPVHNPYYKADDAAEWRKAFDAALSAIDWTRKESKEVAT